MSNPAPRRFPIGRVAVVAWLVTSSVPSVAFRPGDHAVAADDAAAVLVSAVFPNGMAPGDVDEAVQLWNVGARAADLSGYRLATPTGAAVFPARAQLAAGRWWWLAREAGAFARSFGEAPDWAWDDPSLAGWPAGAPADDRPVASMITSGTRLRLANGGTTVQLVAPDGRVVDAVRYAAAGDADAPPDASTGWRGPAVRPYALAGVAAADQVLYRKLDALLGRPVADSDTAADWASDPADPEHGRRVRLPGWDLEAAVRPLRVRVLRPRPDEDGPTVPGGALELAVAPDALLPFLARHLGAARNAIDLTAYTFDNPDLADQLAAQARRGVRVRVGVDGAPAGGWTPAQRWCLARIAAAGGQVLLMAQGGDVRPRYASFHAKLVVVDGATLLIGTENPGLGAAPQPGRPGRRGVFAATAQPEAVAWAKDMLARDLDAGRHADVRPFQPDHPTRGAPPDDYRPPRPSDVPGAYTPRAPDTALLDDVTAMTLLSAPENVLHPTAGLVALVEHAGPGDVVRVAQLREAWRWGTADPPTAGLDGDPTNPRLAAYLAAARRGARVRVLLDGRFDDGGPNSNRDAAARLNAIGRAERLDLESRLADPAGGGLHAKLALVSLASRRDAGAWAASHWVHLGSWNGTEVSAKANREAVMQFESAAGHAYLARLFDADWTGAPALRLWLPLGLRSAGTEAGRWTAHGHGRIRPAIWP